MSFGWSAGDAASLVRLAWNTVQNTRKACGEHDKLTQDVSNLHILLQRLEKELENSASPLNRSDNPCRAEIEAVASGCQKDLLILDKILEKYNALGQKQGGFRKLRHKVWFGNGRMADLPSLRAKMTYYTSVLQAQLHLVSLGSMGRIEKHLEDTGEDLRELKSVVNDITAQLAKGKDSPLTPYLNDDRGVWKAFRRELVEAGFASSFLNKHMEDIKAYFHELGGHELLNIARSGTHGHSEQPEGPHHPNSPSRRVTNQSKSILPPTPNTVGPQTTMLEAMSKQRRSTFALPPPAIDVDEKMHPMEGLVTGEECSLLHQEPGTDMSVIETRDKVPTLTPLDRLFSPVFGRRQIPDKASNITAGDHTEDQAKFELSSASHNSSKRLRHENYSMTQCSSSPDSFFSFASTPNSQQMQLA